MSKEAIFAILPYLRTSQPCTIRGIHFHSSDDLSGLSAEEQSHLETLFSMFFLRNDLHITRMIYAVLELSDDPKEQQESLQRLREAQTLIGYLRSTPQPPGEDPFLPLENASMYVLYPQRFSRYLIWPDDSNPTVENLAKDSTPIEKDLDGYEGQRNWGSAFWVVEGNRIYPPLPRFSLNSEDLYRTVVMFTQQSQNWAFAKLMASREPEGTEFEKRIFTALGWHNKSTADDVREEEALVYLAIAFESLLNLPRGDELTSRFKDTVLILLGSIPRLDSWLEQFYKARSAVVHDGMWPHVMFYAMDFNRKKLEQLYAGNQNKQEPVIEYRSLTTYGRHVFRLCLNAILSSAKAAHQSRLSLLFVPNEERLRNMCEQLRQKEVKPEKRLRSVVRDISALDLYRWEQAGQDVQVETALGTAKIAFQTYLEMNPELPDETLALMKALFEQKKAVSSLEKIRQFENLAGSMRGLSIPFDPETPFYIVLSLVDYVVNSTFLAKAWWEWQEQQQAATPDAPAVKEPIGESPSA